VPRSLIDLLWRDHPDAPAGGARGPQSKVSTGAVVDRAIGLADAGGLSAVTIRHLAAELGISSMSVYTHVLSRADLVVLMVDAVNARMERAPFGRLGWRARVRQVAEVNLALLQAHPWLQDVADDRTALGPGTIAKYDHELAALVPLGLDPVTCDAALTFLLDYVRASARALHTPSRAGELAEHWPESGTRLASYLGDAYPLARSVGAAAGEAMGGVSDPAMAWDFGLALVIEGLATL